MSEIIVGNNNPSCEDSVEFIALDLAKPFGDLEVLALKNFQDILSLTQKTNRTNPMQSSRDLLHETLKTVNDNLDRIDIDGPYRNKIRKKYHIKHILDSKYKWVTSRTDEGLMMHQQNTGFDPSAHIEMESGAQIRFSKYFKQGILGIEISKSLRPRSFERIVSRKIVDKLESKFTKLNHEVRDLEIDPRSMSSQPYGLYKRRYSRYVEKESLEKSVELLREIRQHEGLCIVPTGYDEKQKLQYKEWLSSEKVFKLSKGLPL